MSSPKSLILRKSAKATVRHAAHGTLTKATRQPMRATTLLGVGGLVGVITGWVAARKTAKNPEPPASPYTPAPQPGAAVPA